MSEIDPEVPDLVYSVWLSVIVFVCVLAVWQAVEIVE